VTEGKKIPEIRFKGFTDEWEQCELGELLGITSASRVHKNEWTKSGVPFFRSSDVVADYKGLKNNKAFISFDLYEELSNKSGCVKKDDLLVTGGGSIGIPYLVKTNEPLYFKDADLLWLKNSNNINGYFLYTFFSTLFFRRYVSSITHIGTISHYTIEQAKSTPINISEKKEQDKVGKYLTNLDSLITLHQQKYDKLLNVKKAMLEKMFPKKDADAPEIRFKGFSDKWEERNLGDIGSVVMNKRVFKEQTSYEGDVPFYKIGTFGSKPDAFISKELFEEYKSKYPYPDKGDLLISASGSIGRIVEYIGNDEYFQDSNIVWLKHDNRIINSFLKQFYSVIKWSGLEGSTIKRLYNKNILETSISLPIPKEQTKIGNFFKNLDTLITLHQSELKKLKNIKKACLEKMFV